MSLQIIVTTERGPDIGLTPSEQVAEALAAIGFIRSHEIATPDTAPVRAPVLSNMSTDTMDKPADTPAPQPEAQAAEQPKRERGKSAPGKKRRTAEEVAEDSAAEGIDTSVMETDAQTDTEDAIAAQPQAISTGEERVGPQDDPAEVQAQDAADEAAEAEGGKIADMLTHDDLRKAMGDYVTRYGMPSAQIDGPTIFKAALGDVPAGATEKDGVTPATAWRMTLVPDTQEALGKAVGAWREALEKNPWKREVVGG